MQHGFFRSLFDISFTSFITTKLIKLVYVVTLALIGLGTVLVIVGAFRDDAAYGVGALIGAPLGALLLIVLVRLWLELVIQVFRITELLRDQNHLQRVAFSSAGWTAGPSEPAPAPTTEVPGRVSKCPACGTVPSPGAAFCRNCGERLT